MPDSDDDRLKDFDTILSEVMEARKIDGSPITTPEEMVSALLTAEFAMILFQEIGEEGALAMDQKELERRVDAFMDDVAVIHIPMGDAGEEITGD